MGLLIRVYGVYDRSGGKSIRPYQTVRSYSACKIDRSHAALFVCWSIHSATSGDNPVTLNWRFSPVGRRPAPRGFCLVMGLAIGGALVL